MLLSTLLSAYLITAVSAVASLTWLVLRSRASSRASPSRASKMPCSTNYMGGQVGGKSVINYSYTDAPWKLMGYDVYQFFRLLWASPYIVWPWRPADSGDLCELSPTRGNLFCMFMHLVLTILQLAFVLAIPIMLLLPIWTALIIIVAFFALNTGLARLVNGNKEEFVSNPKYAPELPEHAHEKWVFVNGVAAGSHWLQGNLDRLALTFKRPILGIHNPTAGIIFDVVECLIQRNFGYATNDVRVCYRDLKDILYDPRYSRVVLILHSQGGIIGGMVLDWLLQELPQDLLAKLEVYTFGNAANHMNNPHRHVDSQSRAATRAMGTPQSSTISTTATATDAAPNPTLEAAAAAVASPLTVDIPLRTPGLSETHATRPTAVTDRVIGYIEHYAHSTDFVALWGVLHFATSAPRTHSMPRFMGRVFLRSSDRGGHQFCQHYLDGMFPLEPQKGRKATAVGMERMQCKEEGNEFMDSEISVGLAGDEREMVDEAYADGWLGRGGRRDDAEVEIHGGSPVLTRRGTRRVKKVKELSRLWAYRNGKSPDDLHGAVTRGATM